MKAQFLIFIVISAIIISCSNKNKKENLDKINPVIYQDGENYKIVGDVDTLTMISLFNITEKCEDLSNLNENIDFLSRIIDTLELTYYFPFCDCQDWVLSSIHEKAFGEDTSLNNPDARGQTQFNLSEYGFYIEPASEEIKLNWRICVTGTKVRFIGRKYSDLRLPENDEFTTDNPTLGKVFRYYSFEIIKPYKFWGPQQFFDVQECDGRTDSLFQTVILTIE